MQNFQAGLQVGLKLNYNLTIQVDKAYNAKFS
jgi:hypothetical protein